MKEMSEEEENKEEKKIDKNLEKAEQNSEREEGINKAAQRLEDANKVAQKIESDRKAREVEAQAAGQSEAVAGNKEESPADYAKRITAGKLEDDERKEK